MAFRELIEIYASYFSPLIFDLFIGSIQLRKIQAFQDIHSY